MSKLLKWKKVLNLEDIENSDFPKALKPCRSHSASHSFYYDSNIFDKKQSNKTQIQRSFSKEINRDHILYRVNLTPKLSIYDLELNKEEAFPKSAKNSVLSLNINKKYTHMKNKISTWSTNIASLVSNSKDSIDINK